MFSVDLCVSFQLDKADELCTEENANDTVTVSDSDVSQCETARLTASEFYCCVLSYFHFIDFDFCAVVLMLLISQQ